jgi:copper chaperone CopZ
VSTTSATKQSPTVSDQQLASQDSLETVTVKVEGMSCTACEVPIRDALARMPGVSSADVSYQRGDAQIKYAKADQGR